MARDAAPAPPPSYLAWRPAPPLDAFIDTLWTSQRPAGLAHAREWNLPTGRADLVVPLDRPALRRFADGHDAAGQWLAGGLLQGAMRTASLRCTATASVVVGVHFKPAGLCGWLHQPADALAGQVVPLEALWPGLADQLREQAWAGGRLAPPALRLQQLQALLRQRLRPDARPQPMVDWALQRLAAGHAPGAVQRASGWSAASFARRFRQACGLSPQQHLALWRFGRTLSAARQGLPWAQVAADLGYADQPHLVRQFRRFAGTTPVAWQRAATDWAQHMAWTEPV